MDWLGLVSALGDILGEDTWVRWVTFFVDIVCEMVWFRLVSFFGGIFGEDAWLVLVFFFVDIF